jgi:hypothetical protein
MFLNVVRCSTAVAMLLAELVSGRCGLALAMAIGAVQVLEHGTELDGDVERIEKLKPALRQVLGKMIAQSSAEHEASKAADPLRSLANAFMGSAKRGQS